MSMSDAERNYNEGYEAGRKAERESLTNAIVDRRGLSGADLKRAQEYAAEIIALAEPAAPPATEASAGGGGMLLFVPEPARPLTLEDRARAIMPNAVPSDLMTEHWTDTFAREVSKLARDFAREALRAAIGCGVRLGEPDENGEQPVFHEATIILSRVDGRTDREACDEHVNEIVSAAIHAAEKGEVPR